MRRSVESTKFATPACLNTPLVLLFPAADIAWAQSSIRAGVHIEAEGFRANFSPPPTERACATTDEQLFETNSYPPRAPCLDAISFLHQPAIAASSRSSIEIMTFG